jgi:hypothetical protein
MGGVEDAIADGVGGGGIGEVVVPVLGVELTGDDRRACSVAILEDLEKITPLGVGDGSDGEVVDDEDVEASEAREDAWKRAVGPCEAELIEESRGATIRAAEAFATRLVDELELPRFGGQI